MSEYRINEQASKKDKKRKTKETKKSNNIIEFNVGLTLSLN